MDKQLANYKKDIVSQLQILETELANATASERKAVVARAQLLHDLHAIRVRDFQHERLIHLVVTLFFGVLLLLSAAGGLWALTLAADPAGPMLNILTWTLCALLFVTELLYVRHYYLLENGVQALYGLTKRLQVILR